MHSLRGALGPWQTWDPVEELSDGLFCLQASGFHREDGNNNSGFGGSLCD